MPTYEYHCEKCKKSFELFQSMKDQPVEMCPETHCQRKTWGKGKVKRQLGSGAGLIFKGSGFYITDYRSEGYKTAAKNDSTTTSPSSSGTEKSPKTESATGAKSAKSDKKSP